MRDWIHSKTHKWWFKTAGLEKEYSDEHIENTALQQWLAIKSKVCSDTPLQNIKEVLWDMLIESLGQAEAEEWRNRMRTTKPKKLPIACGDIIEGKSGKAYYDCTVLEIIDKPRGLSLVRVR